jgi:hypothetical protein
LLVAGLFCVYYRHEQHTAGGTVPPGAAPPAAPTGNTGTDIIHGILDFLGGVGTAPAATPAAGPHRYRQTVLPAHHPVTSQTAVHPTPPTTNPAADPYTQWRGILARPTANFACSSCGGGSNHVGTWFDAVSHTRICKACQDPIRTVT